MNQIKNIFKNHSTSLVKRGWNMSCLQILVYYCKNKLLSQLLHEKRVPKGTLCTEGFVTVRRTV